MLDPRTRGIRGALNALNRQRIHRGAPTLADRVFAPALLMDAVLVLCGAAVVAMTAQFVVPLWPVPSTGQIIGVLGAGYFLGALRGGLALTLYLGLGAAGLPVFNNGGAGVAHLTGPTGGYLFAFVIAAVLAGLAAQRKIDRGFVGAFACSLAITMLVYAIGVAWLMVVNGYGLGEALANGFTPLFFAGVVKVLVVAILMPAAWRFDATLSRRAAESALDRRTDSLKS